MNFAKTSVLLKCLRAQIRNHYRNVRNKKVSELQKKVCDYERALGDLFLLTKDSNHVFIEYDEVLVGFLFDGIKRLHNEIATLNIALSESIKREEIARKVIDQKRKEK